MLAGALSAVEATIGHEFSNRKLLVVALTHRSYGHPNNERLEFLGDGVLNCVIAEFLYCQRADLSEGDLSRARASLVRADTLTEVAQACSLGDCLRFGDGETASGGASRPSILADALEAIIGAILLDSGYPECRAVIGALYGDRIAAAIAVAGHKDHKTALQERLQGQRLPLPVYALEGVIGLAHERTFVVQCSITDLDISTRGSGSSRRTAEQAAAGEALRLLASHERSLERS